MARKKDWSLLDVFFFEVAIYDEVNNLYTGCRQMALNDPEKVEFQGGFVVSA
jgi:hypothetical protein